MNQPLSCYTCTSILLRDTMSSHHRWDQKDVKDVKITRQYYARARLRGHRLSNWKRGGNQF